MHKSVAEYLRELRRELAGSDPALVQDALADAEEHFSSAPGWGAMESENVNAGISSLFESYGTPQEVAAAYREMEKRLPLPLTAFRRKEPKSLWGKFFGVVADIQTWSALLYMLSALVTGFIYGIWGLVGGAFSLMFLIFIIGVPLVGLFLLSIRILALMEGRIIETLLGIRMPRKPIFVHKGLSWSQKFKALVLESHTWKALLYLILRFPLGIVYSLGTAVLLSFSIKFALYPVWYFWLNRSLLNFRQPYFPPEGLIPLISLVGILVFFLILHLVRWLGRQQGRLAKYLLVRK